MAREIPRDRVLVLAAHPDDEILGCGATMARHVAAGDDVHILIVASGAASRNPSDLQENILALQDAAASAAEVLGAQPPAFLGLPDNRLDSLPLLDIVQAVEGVINNIEPTIIYTHHQGDLNIDHRLVSQAAMTACRPLPGATIRAIYAFETVSSTEWGRHIPGPEFTPNHFVDIEGYLATKMKALECYEMEMRAFPHPRSYRAVEAHAVVRGSSAGLMAAEAFVQVRNIVRSPLIRPLRPDQK